MVFSNAGSLVFFFFFQQLPVAGRLSREFATGLLINQPCLLRWDLMFDIEKLVSRWPLLFGPKELLSATGGQMP